MANGVKVLLNNRFEMTELWGGNALEKWLFDLWHTRLG